MIIVAQDNKHIINFDMFDYIDVVLRGDGFWNEIFAENSDNAILLGRYNTEGEAKEVMRKFAQSYGAINVFYVPKEVEENE